LSSLSVTVPDNAQAQRVLDFTSAHPYMRCAAIFHTAEDFERCRVKFVAQGAKAPPRLAIRRRNPSPGPSCHSNNSNNNNNVSPPHHFHHQYSSPSSSS